MSPRHWSSGEMSRWHVKKPLGAKIIRKYAAHEWPGNCLELAGRFADFPLCENDGSTRLPARQLLNWHEGA